MSRSVPPFTNVSATEHGPVYNMESFEGALVDELCKQLNATCEVLGLFGL